MNHPVMCWEWSTPDAVTIAPMAEASSTGTDVWHSDHSSSIRLPGNAMSVIRSNVSVRAATRRNTDVLGNTSENTLNIPVKSVLSALSTRLGDVSTPLVQEHKIS